MRRCLYLFIWIIVHLNSFGLSVYFIGNSFTEKTWPDLIVSETTFPEGSSADAVGWSIKQGRPFSSQINDPDSATHTSPEGNWVTQLETREWDVVVIQPHT